VWSSGLGTVGRDPGNKPVLVYLTGFLFTTDNQLIAPQVRKKIPFSRHVLYMVVYTNMNSTSEKYYSMSAVKKTLQ
jgi:hypothetical protein